MQTEQRSLRVKETRSERKETDQRVPNLSALALMVNNEHIRYLPEKLLTLLLFSFLVIMEVEV